VPEPVEWFRVVGSQLGGAGEEVLRGIPADGGPSEVDAPEDDEDVGVPWMEILQSFGDAACFGEAARGEERLRQGQSRLSLLEGQRDEDGQQCRGVAPTAGLSRPAGTAR
jgi:hypothetical protein